MCFLFQELFSSEHDMLKAEIEGMEFPMNGPMRRHGVAACRFSYGCSALC